MTSHLVIGDSHSKPGVDNDRFERLGKLCLDLRPDVIIDMGDWADMESLSSYDKGRRSFEGRRYTKDVEAARDARDRFNKPIERYNSRQRKNGKKQYLPHKVSLLGNHEHRIERATDSTPELHGTISSKDLGAEQFGWVEHPFLNNVTLDGVTYSHYFTSGVMGRPIGGEYPAASLLKKKFVSCTAGHNHLRDFCERTRVDGQKILGLSTGCHFDHWEDWAGDANTMYWRGVVLCKNVVNGYYNPEFIDIKEIEDRYGKN